MGKSNAAPKKHGLQVRSIKLAMFFSKGKRLIKFFTCERFQLSFKIRKLGKPLFIRLVLLCILFLFLL